MRIYPAGCRHVEQSTLIEVSNNDIAQQTHPLQSQVLGRDAVPAATDQLGALLDAAADAMILIDANGLITRFNHMAECLFGYVATEIIGQNVSVLMPTAVGKEHNHYLQRYHSTGHPNIIGKGREVLGQHRTGRQFPIHLSVGEFKYGNEHGFVGILRDVSELHAHDEAIRRNLGEHFALFENTPTAILITDVEAMRHTANGSFEALFGFTNEELHTLGFREIINRIVFIEDCAAAAVLFGKTLEFGTGADCIMRFQKRDGGMFRGRLFVGATLDDHQKVRQIISKVVDLSALDTAALEIGELRARLAHVNRLGTLGEMVSGIAHELSQPLAAIANYANATKRLLLAGLAQPAELAGIMQKISTQAERAGNVIQGLRKQARRDPTDHKTIECNALIREVLQLVEFELRAASHRLVLNLDPAEPTILGNDVYFQQVILNLLRNALEVTNHEGSTRIITITSTALATGKVEIVIRDSGPVLSKEIEQHLFEPFFTTKPQGMGMGLSICRSLVSDFDGKLSYRPGDGGGNEFVLLLPTGSSN